VGAYTAFNWDKTNALQEALTSTQEVLKEMRRIVGDDKKIVYTFWVASWDMSPRELAHPTGEEIARIAQQAVDLGIRHVDYYGYRIGDWRVTSEEWLRLLPGIGKSYPVTKQLPGKFLRDRREVFLNLAEFNRKLRMQ
jgi:undecaprenyl pyrophosphate synthase